MCTREARTQQFSSICANGAPKYVVVFICKNGVQFGVVVLYGFESGAKIFCPPFFVVNFFVCLGHSNNLSEVKGLLPIMNIDRGIFTNNPII